MYALLSLLFSATLLPSHGGTLTVTRSSESAPVVIGTNHHDGLRCSATIDPADAEDAASLLFEAIDDPGTVKSWADPGQTLETYSNGANVWLRAVSIAPPKSVHDACWLLLEHDEAKRAVVLIEAAGAF